MNFFDILRSLLFFRRKSSSYEELDHDSLQSFTPYMINRWLSFSDKSKAIFVNETFNRFTSLFDNKSDSYKFYYYLTPQSSYKKIEYVKKKKEEKEKEDVNIKLFAANNLLSTRELTMYLALQE